jgi:hypothetical protein
MQRADLLVLIGLFLWLFVGRDIALPFLDTTQKTPTATQKSSQSSPIGPSIALEKVAVCQCVSCKKHHAGTNAIKDSSASCCCESNENPETAPAIRALCDERDPFHVPTLPPLWLELRDLLATPPLLTIYPTVTSSVVSYFGYQASPTSPPPRFLS